MTVTDSFTGKTSTIALADADTSSTHRVEVERRVRHGRAAAQRARSRTATTADRRHCSTARRDVHRWRSSSTAVDAGSQLGFAATPYAGLDVAGTINGKAATGIGPVAHGADRSTTNPAQGLPCLYTGTTPPETANVTYVLGLGGADVRGRRSLAAVRRRHDPGPGEHHSDGIDSAHKRAADVQVASTSSAHR